MRLKTCEKEATQNKHVKAKTKQTRILGFWVTASHTLEQVCLHMNLAWVHKLDHAYVVLTKKTKKTQKQSITLKQQTNNLRAKKGKNN